MKRLFLSIILLITVTVCFSQVDYNKYSKSSLTVDKIAEPFLEELIYEGEERGFYIRSLIFEKVDFILFDSSLKAQGLIEGVSEDGRTIYLSTEIKNDSLKIKIALYHGIGHIFKNNGNHICYSCSEIMSKYLPINLKDFEENWEEKLNEYFKWLNKKL